MIEAVIAFVIVVVVGISLDWLISSRLAAYYVNVDYHYRASLARCSTIVIAAAVFAYSYMRFDGSHAWAPGLFAFSLLVLVFIVLVIIDVVRAVSGSAKVPPSPEE